MEENNQNNMEQNTAQNIDQVNNNETQVTNVDPVVEQNVQPEPVIDTTNQVEENVQNNIEEPKKKSKLPIIILIIVLLALIGVGGYFAYEKYFNKPEISANPTNEETPTEEKIKPIEFDEITLKELDEDFGINYGGYYYSTNMPYVDNYLYSSTIKVDKISTKEIKNKTSITLEDISYCNSINECKNPKNADLIIKLENNKIKFELENNKKIFDIDNVVAVDAFSFNMFKTSVIILTYLTNNNELYTTIFDMINLNTFKEDYNITNQKILANDALAFEIIESSTFDATIIEETYRILYLDKSNNKKASNITCSSDTKCKFEFVDITKLDRNNYDQSIYSLSAFSNNALYIIDKKDDKTINYITNEKNEILDAKQTFKYINEEEAIDYYVLTNDGYFYKLNINTKGITVSLVNNTKVKNQYTTDETIDDEDEPYTIYYDVFEFEDGKKISFETWID